MQGALAFSKLRKVSALKHSAPVMHFHLDVALTAYRLLRATGPRIYVRRPQQGHLRLVQRHYESSFFR